MSTLQAARETTPDGTLPACAWPGGYPLYYLTADGLTICPACANQEDTSDPVQAYDVHWEGEPRDCEDGSSADCSKTIESAYGITD